MCPFNHGAFVQIRGLNRNKNDAIIVGNILFMTLFLSVGCNLCAFLTMFFIFLRMNSQMKKMY